MTKNDYLASPSKASSLPYWKSVSFVIPDNMLVIRDDQYRKEDYPNYIDEPYYKMVHRLDNVGAPILDKAYKLVRSETIDFVNHINECYGDSLTLEDLANYQKRPSFDEDLWVSVVNFHGKIIASAVGEVDKEIREGIIEWVEVSKEYRKQGLGTFLVNKLLSLMKNKADFVTVSGRLNSEHQPIKLYQKCGFKEEVIWHIMKKDHMLSIAENKRIKLIPITLEMIDKLLISDKAFYDAFGLVNEGDEYLTPSPEYLHKIRKCLEEHPEEYPLAVDQLIVLKDTNTVIGTIYYKKLPNHGATEVGYGMNPKYRGNGYMTEALALLLEYGKNNGVTIVFADTLCNNFKSQNVLDRNGFIAYKEDGHTMWFTKMLL